MQGNDGRILPPAHKAFHEKRLTNEKEAVSLFSLGLDTQKYQSYMVNLARYPPDGTNIFIENLACGARFCYKAMVVLSIYVTVWLYFKEVRPI